ncbi:uncharacterized protein LOC102608378 isoform X1 [Citrus sinensis]|uniref:uncharacterized protein LOC102608378 isoform X1 n=1 Tax=Citrus sinensis TaxID=2711 RepID=UPI0022794F67|nr:uncharacterized protein LOC102608378 isoform X1 [Citrus sinensis]
MPVNIGATLNHISRESSDIRRLADFYKEIFGFEEIEAPNFGEFKVIWLNLPGAFALHLIERNPGTKLPEGPYSTTSPTADPSHLPRGHHICFTVSDFDSFLQTLKQKLLLPREDFLPKFTHVKHLQKWIMLSPLSSHVKLQHKPSKLKS